MTKSVSSWTLFPVTVEMISRFRSPAEVREEARLVARHSEHRPRGHRLHQAAAQFQLYTGHDAPLAAMDRALAEQLA